MSDYGVTWLDPSVQPGEQYTQIFQCDTEDEATAFIGGLEWAIPDRVHTGEFAIDGPSEDE